SAVKSVEKLDRAPVSLIPRVGKESGTNAEGEEKGSPKKERCDESADGGRVATVVMEVASQSTAGWSRFGPSMSSDEALAASSGADARRPTNRYEVAALKRLVAAVPKSDPRWGFRTGARDKVLRQSG
ncbi:hypothetical protein FOZ63_016954, partial [Perkinsus olseni]